MTRRTRTTDPKGPGGSKESVTRKTPETSQTPKASGGGHNGAGGPADEPPAAFQNVVETLRRAVASEHREELELEEMPAPKRLAPYSAALSGAVYRDDDEIAGGRLIVLYDPAGRNGWAGGFRVVVHIHADLEPEIASDELIGRVAWSWLTEALEPEGYTGISGTVTRAVSEPFGGKAEEPVTTDIELRASWSPAGDDLAGHVRAWCEVMCLAAGLPPDGVSALHPGPDRPRS